jgi:acyl-coenzyme A thioesterase 9
MATRFLRAKLAPSKTLDLAPGNLTRARVFHSATTLRTDGVYKALTEMRVRTPWIKALQERREAEQDHKTPVAQKVQPDLTPKKMSDSYVSLVLPLSVSTFVALPTFLCNG